MAIEESPSPGVAQVSAPSAQSAARPGSSEPSRPSRKLATALLTALIVVVAGWSSFRVFTSSSGIDLIDGGLDPRGFRVATVAADGGDPVRFDPCTPIHYVINPADAPAGAVEDVHTAVALTSSASGLKFIYDGESDEVFLNDRKPYQPDRYGDRWAPVLISWASGPLPGAAKAADPGAHPVAVGGGMYVDNGKGKAVYVTGVATFDATAELAGGFHGKTWGQVMLHELGHVVGLGHVEDGRSVMNPVLGLRPAAWSDGDRAGLRELGIGAPCVKAPVP